MSNHNAPLRPTRARSRGWFQFSLRTALWMMVVLAVALGWLADRSKLQRQLAEERLEMEALRIARDYMGQGYGESTLDPSVLPGYIYSPYGSTALLASGEADEATVEHLKDFLAGEPTYLANVGGSSGWIFGSGRAMPPFDGTSSSIFLADTAVIRSLNYLDIGRGRWVNVVQDVAPKDAGSVPELIKRLADKDATMRARAACTLARLGPNAQDAVPALLGRLTDADAAVRYHAVYALGRIRTNTPEVVAGLRAIMDDDAGPASPLAAQIVHRIDPSIDVVPRLIELLDQPDAETRRRAMTALPSVQQQPAAAGAETGGPAQALPQLKRLLADPHALARTTAMRAIARLAPLAEAHALLGEVVKRGPGTDRETWTFASLLWNGLDRQMRAIQSTDEPGSP